HCREISALAGRIRHVLVGKVANGGLGGRQRHRIHAAACARRRHAPTSTASLSAMDCTAASSPMVPQNHSRAAASKIVRPTANPLTTLNGAAATKEPISSAGGADKPSST